MKKKLLSLALALALCLSLAAPALASGVPYIVDETGNIWTLDEEPKGSGRGWTWVRTPGNATSLLTLNGFNGEWIWDNGGVDIELSPGSKNTVGGLSFLYSDSVIGGSGELVVYDKTGESASAIQCTEATVTLKDGLVMTGGASPSDNFPLTFNSDGYAATASGVVAKYVRIAPKSSGASAAGFTDVAANSPYAAAIQWAVDKKITTGKTATTFGPGDTCTIGHANTFLWRNAGRPAPTAEGVDLLTDMDKAEMWVLNDAGYMDRLDNRSDTCTRLWFVYALWVMAGEPEASLESQFSDMVLDNLGRHDYMKAVNWAVSKGITTGKTAATFAPNDPCTRCQIVTFLFLAYK